MYTALSNRANLRFAGGDYELAVSDYSAAIALKPDSVSYDGRGQAYLQQKKYDLAIADFTAVLQHEASTFDGHYYLGIALLGKGENGHAIENLSLALRLAPETSRAAVHFYRGIAFRQFGALDKAIEDETEAHRLQPGDFSSLLTRGDAWAAKGDYDKTIADFDEVILNQPRWPGGYAATHGHWRQTP